MSNTSTLLRMIDTSLPALSGSGVVYDRSNNILLTRGYTSAAGNTYFQGIRFSERIVVNYDLGQGYAYLFLNGIRVYGYNGRDKRLIGSRSYYCCCFNEQYAMNEAAGIVADYIRGQMKEMNAHCDESELLQFSKQLVQATYSSMKLLSQE